MPVFIITVQCVAHDAAHDSESLSRPGEIGTPSNTSRSSQLLYSNLQKQYNTDEFSESVTVPCVQEYSALYNGDIGRQRRSLDPVSGSCTVRSEAMFTTYSRHYTDTAHSTISTPTRYICLQGPSPLPHPYPASHARACRDVYNILVHDCNSFLPIPSPHCEAATRLP
jgi:hypothetical protein